MKRFGYVPRHFVVEEVKSLPFVMLHIGVIRMDGVMQVILKLKLKDLRLLNHPFHRAVAQPGLHIPSADIRMHSRKPDLLDVDLFLARPQRGIKMLPVFVD